jgi:hypothetical protein
LVFTFFYFHSLVFTFINFQVLSLVAFTFFHLLSLSFTRRKLHTIPIYYHGP